MPCSQPEVRTAAPGGHFEEEADRARSHLGNRGRRVSPRPVGGRAPRPLSGGPRGADLILVPRRGGTTLPLLRLDRDFSLKNLAHVYKGGGAWPKPSCPRGERVTNDRVSPGSGSSRWSCSSGSSSQEALLPKVHRTRISQHLWIRFLRFGGNPAPWTGLRLPNCRFRQLRIQARRKFVGIGVAAPLSYVTKVAPWAPTGSGLLRS